MSVNKNELNKIIKKYYPKKIDGLDRYYIETDEYKNLFKKCKENIKKNDKKWPCFLEEITSIYRKDIIILGKTNYFLKQPSFSVQISNYSDKVCANIYLSFVIPYYYISILELKNDVWEETNINPNLILNISFSVINTLMFKMFKAKIFPKQLLETKVPNISFDLIKEGGFTFKNAFFNNKNIII